MKTVFVTTIEDQRAVAKVMKDVGINVDNVMIPRGERYELEDIPQSVASCLTFSSDLAFNGMAEKAKMGKVIILQHHEDFKKHIRDGSFERPIVHAFDNEGTKISIKNGNKQNISSNLKRRLLQDSQEDTKRDLEMELAAAREALREVQKQGHSVEQSVNEFDHALRKLDLEIRNIDSASKKVKKSKEANKNKLEELNHDTSLDTTDLEEELDELAKVIAERQRVLEVSKVDMKAATTAQVEADAAAEASKKCQSAARAEMDRLEASQRDFINQKAMFLKNQNIAKKAVEEFVGKLEAAETSSTNLAEKHASLKQQVEAATAELLGDSWDGRPLKVGTLSKEMLSKKKAQLQSEFDAKKLDVGLENKSKEQTSGRLAAARADLHKVEEQHQELNTLIVKLSHDVTKRVAKLKTMREQNSKTVKRQFNNYLQNRRMKGKVVFDHDNQTLNMLVQTDENDTNTLTSDVRNMSGGERSYVTLCLLLSLGHIIECPFRLMDEYDVFMDQITRRTTLKQIQMYAVDPIQNGRQFIIITPQDLSDVQTSNDVRVHRVKPPVRGAARSAQQRTVTEAFGGDKDEDDD
jgi:chromosome segregation ATPase